MFHALAYAALLFASDEPPSESDDPDAGSPTPVRSSTGVLSGQVRSQVQALPDVVVTVTSPSLQGESVVVTDELGRFRVPDLPPGIYTIRLEKEGYRPYSRMGVDLTLNRDGNLGEFVLLDEPMDEVIVCGCGPPPVDVSETQATWRSVLWSGGLVPLSDPFESGGVSRSFDTRVRTFPGLSAGRNGTRNGTDPARELGARLDGIPVREPVTGLLATPVAGAFVDESLAVTDAPHSTYGGSTSGWLEASTLSGGNEMHGRIFATVTPSGLDTAATTLGDVGAGLGGYIVKDTLWFAAAGQWPWATPVSLDPGAQGLLKLTALLSPDARIEARYLDTGARLLDHAVRSRLGAVVGAFSLNDKKLLFDLNAWWMGISDRSASPVLDLSSQSIGGAGTTTVLMRLWGHHVLKLGFEARSSHTASAGRDVLSSFIDESWAVADRITVLLGARTDLQRVRSSAGEATVSGGLLPRLGVVFDPTYSGRVKIFGWWGRLEDDLPLALFQAQAGQPPAVFASGLRPPAAEAWSLGTEFEVRPFVAGLRYSERRLVSAVALLDEGGRPMVVNPGEEPVSSGQPESRLERTVTLTVSHPFGDLWSLDASARLQWVRANVLGVALLDPDPVSEPVEAWLPEFKLTAGRLFPLSPMWALQLGASVAVWRALPETERLRVPDLEWRDRVDLRLGLSVRTGREGVLSFSVEGFDLFDSGFRRNSLGGRSVRLGVEATF